MLKPLLILALSLLSFAAQAACPDNCQFDDAPSAAIPIGSKLVALKDQCYSVDPRGDFAQSPFPVSYKSFSACYIHFNQQGNPTKVFQRGDELIINSVRAIDEGPETEHALYLGVTNPAVKYIQCFVHYTDEGGNGRYRTPSIGEVRKMLNGETALILPNPEKL